MQNANGDETSKKKDGQSCTTGQWQMNRCTIVAVEGRWTKDMAHTVVGKRWSCSQVKKKIIFMLQKNYMKSTVIPFWMETAGTAGDSGKQM